MIPFGVLPLIVFAAVVLLRAGRLPNVTKIIAIVLLAALAISCQFGNTVRSALSDAVYANMTIDDARPDEQLTATKEKILKKVVKETGTDSVVVSDPLNGSMYATAMYGADMLFPIYNAKAEKNGAIFGQTENAFASGDGKALTNTVLPAERGWRCILPEHGRPGAEPADVHVQAAVRHVPRSEADRPVRQRWHDAQGSGLF